jgi:signal transduction histidine kinase
MIETSTVQARPALAAAAVTNTYQIAWYAADSPTASWLQTATAGRDEATLLKLSGDLEAFSDDLHRTVMAVSPDDPIAMSPGFPLHTTKYPDAYFFCVGLDDRSWVVFTGFNRDWGLDQSERLAIWATFIVVSFLAVSVVASRQLSQPIRRFADAVRLAGMNPQAPPIAEEGPQELRGVIAAFNEMKAQIREFVAYRTAMLAAISHDLRTPLTRMRLRGEFIEDEVQRTKLFRDVDEMGAMIDGALAFFRGDDNDAATRPFDLPGLLQSIADDYADQGIAIGYAGPDRLVFAGRPRARKSRFTHQNEKDLK